MNTEKLIAKGVEKHFNGQQVLFKVDSLKEHFDGLQIHKTDILSIEDVDYVKPTDVDFSAATANEVEPKQEEEIEEAPLVPEMCYDEAEKIIKEGGFVALPEWGGFWFGNIKTGEVLVLTKEGEITNTPFEEYKESKDWIEVVPSEEQMQLVKNYFESLEVPVVDDIEVVVTEEVIPDASPEVIEEEVSVDEKVPEPIAETTAPKAKKK